MAWWVGVIIALPLLFVVGVVYNSIKAQRKLEREMLPDILKAREAERERMRRLGLAQLPAYDDEDDDWPQRGVRAPGPQAADQSASAPASSAGTEQQDKARQY